MSSRAAATLVGLALVAASARPVRGQPPSFIAHEVATGLRGGYQTVAADLNKDGKPDLIAVATGLRELVWFENPGWTRHVLASGLTAPINVGLADVDGDGIPEVAVAHGFSTNPSRSAGIVSLLTHGANPAEPWTAREIDRSPTAHRLRWIADDRGSRMLINSPLAGAASRQPDYAGATPIYFYRAPDWKRELVTEAEHGVVHAIEVAKLAPSGPDVLLAAGFMGVHEYRFTGGTWVRRPVIAGDPAPAPLSGSSEISVGRIGDARFLTTIEPWHGTKVVVYREHAGRWERAVIDTTLNDGHSLVVADLDGDRRDELIVGQRGTPALWLYSVGADGTRWSRTTVDDAMPAAGCTTADFNGDGRIDIACIGTSTATLKWYENTRRP